MSIMPHRGNGIATRSNRIRPQSEVIEYEGEGGEIFEIEAGGSPLGLATRAEIDAQVSTAKRFPRSIKKFFDAAKAMVSLDPDVARSCSYVLKRSGKPIVGPSVRLAEIVAACYGNIRTSSRIVEEDDRFVTAEAICLDVENNNGIAVQVRRRITGGDGRRYSEDMIATTSQAATAIARRNAVFAVVPSAFVKPIHELAMKTAAGDGESFATTRAKRIDKITKKGIHADRVFAVLDVDGIEDITYEHMSILDGLADRIKDGEITIDEAFPPLDSASRSTEPLTRTSSLKNKLAPTAPKVTVVPEPVVTPEPEDESQEVPELATVAAEVWTEGRE